MPGPLWEATRDLHHACEQHPVGAAMASGTPPVRWYAQWLGSLYVIHSVVDQYLPACTGRLAPLAKDIAALQGSPTYALPAAEYAASLRPDHSVMGAGYVLLGAHLMGGEVMRRRLEGFPTAHLEWDDRRAALAELMVIREQAELAEPARACFSALLATMDEIQGGTPSE